MTTLIQIRIVCRFAIRHVTYPKARNIFVISRTFHDARDTIIELRIKALWARWV